MTVPNNSLEARKKKAIWRAGHRGIREMDLLMGDFAQKHVPEMDESELQSFEALIEVNDLDLYNWLLGMEETPEDYQTGIFARLKQHVPDGD